MKSLFTLSYNEYEKIINKRKSRGLLIILGIIVAVSGVIYFYIENTINLSFIGGNNYPIWILNLLMVFILPLFIAMTISDSIAGEYNKGTLINVYILPVSKEIIYISKIVGTLMYSFMMAIIILITSILTSILTSGLFVFSNIGLILESYFEAIFVLGLVISFVALISLMVKSSNMAIIISILLLFAFRVIGIFVSEWSLLLPSTILEDYNKIFVQSNISLLLISISYYIIFTILGILIFQKKEV